MPPKRNITCDDLYRFRFVSDAQLAPNDSGVLFTLSRFHPDRRKDTYESHVWHVKVAGGAPVQFTNSNE